MIEMCVIPLTPNEWGIGLIQISYNVLLFANQTHISTDTFIITYPPCTEYGTMGHRMAE
ncbi:MAG: hypothetical protein AEth_00309 [Candidatus Argoarchaeum ethanivorans]|uniref:Uncharacterized protein n=1 Tax=Candidatus Argoarchaeum ethanivorans TaxID=2608793 RepID=A0A8B3S357_9EURY|nr:MAG: hypothetical protein AEth_00309 [Candidatus Argoarchaeum ethanivorans]